MYIAITGNRARYTIPAMYEAVEVRYWTSELVLFLSVFLGIKNIQDLKTGSENHQKIMITFPFFRSLLFLPKINLHKKIIITSFYRSNIHQENEFQIRLYFLNKNSENIKKYNMLCIQRGSARDVKLNTRSINGLFNYFP